MKQLNLLFIITLITSSPGYSDIFNWDIINKDGTVIHSIVKAKNVQPYSNGLMVVEYDGYFELLDKNFVVRVQKPFQLKQFAKLKSDRISYYDDKIGKYGYLDSTGSISIQPMFDSTEDFVNGFAVVGFGDTSAPPPHELDYKIIDASGSIRSNFSSSYIFLSGTSLGKGIAYTNGQYSIIQRDNSNWKISEAQQTKYQTLVPAGKYIIYRKNNKYGFMSWDAVEQTPPIYTSVRATGSENFFIVTLDSETNIIQSPSWKTERITSGITDILSDGRFVIYTENDRKGVFDLILGKKIIEPIFSSITWYSEGVFNVQKNGLHGFLLPSGNFLSEPKYNRIFSFNEGFGIGGVLIDN